LQVPRQSTRQSAGAFLMSVSSLSKVFFASVLSAHAALALGATPATPATHPCATITDPGQRLDCYDAAFPVVRDSGSTSDSGSSNAEKTHKEFGLNKQQLRERDSELKPEISPSRVEGVVAAVSYQAGGQRLVRLEDGASWLLTEGRSRGTLNAGDRVFIRKAALGTFMMVTPSNVALRARRIN
jgi:hypothetical protein